MSAIPWTRGLANCYFIYLFIDASNTYIPLQSCGVIVYQQFQGLQVKI